MTEAIYVAKAVAVFYLFSILMSIAVDRIPTRRPGFSLKNSVSEALKINTAMLIIIAVVGGFAWLIFTAI